ncbi:hypothetical protein H8R18_00555 [Nanchangia anserum]|uniref:glycosyl hydrolase n=1 Tax=Nanchangia anserum TaxID=2692125 RepID=UPI001884009A|nr:glycosyl hydrolase [Nanchangia anserum]QOX81908.1 hypothetical protein H8R18_00555 [Nanchangia anserum]
MSTPEALHHPQHRYHLDAARFATPHSGDRPGIRWWWMHPRDAHTLTDELDHIAQAGFGEVEIAFSPDFWATQHQRDCLHAVLVRARELDIGVSMTLGANWPLTTPNTTTGTPHAAQELQYGHTRVEKGPCTITIPAPFDDPEITRPSRLIAVIAARVLTEGDDISIVPSTKPFGPPTTVIGPDTPTILDPTTLRDITTHVTGTRLTWNAPAGTWALIAFWQRDTAQAYTSFLDPHATRAALAYLDTHQIGPDNAPLLPDVGRDMFEDSLELNADTLFWSDDFLDHFHAWHGYDLRPYLPLLLSHGMCHYWVPNTDTPSHFETPTTLAQRIRTDYNTLLTHLYITNHLSIIHTWATGHGMRHKAQAAYGHNLGPIASFRALAAQGGRAEGESLNAGERIPVHRNHPLWRWSLDWMRCVVAGAHQGGTTRISSELGAQLGAAFTFSLGDYRALLNKEWASGITTPIVHGYASQAPNCQWPGESRFGHFVAESWNREHYPEWTNWPALTDRWARTVTVLETGTPRTDVAIYYDGFLTTAARGTPEDDATAPERIADTTALENAGYSVHYIDSSGILEAPIGHGELFPNGPGYRALILATTRLAARALTALRRIAATGVPIVIVGDLPAGDSGWGGGDRDDNVNNTLTTLLTTEHVRHVDTWAKIPHTLRDLNVAPRYAFPGGNILTQVRESDDATYLLAYNTTDHQVTAPIPSTAPTMHQLDPDTGHTHRLDHTPAPTIEIEAGDIALLRLSNTPAPEWDALAAPVAPVPGACEAELGPWTIAVAGARGEDLMLTRAHLGDWRDDDELGEVSGVAIYRTPVRWPREVRGTVWCSLGRIDGSARIREGNAFGAPIISDRPVALPPAAYAEGILEIEVRTPLRNAALAAGVVTAGPWPIELTTRPQGLSGPVRVWASPDR